MFHAVLAADGTPAQAHLNDLLRVAALVPDREFGTFLATAVRFANSPINTINSMGDGNAAVRSAADAKHLAAAAAALGTVGQGLGILLDEFFRHKCVLGLALARKHASLAGSPLPLRQAARVSDILARQPGSGSGFGHQGQQINLRPQKAVRRNLLPPRFLNMAQNAQVHARAHPLPHLHAKFNPGPQPQVYPQLKPKFKPNVKPQLQFPSHILHQKRGHPD
jgi:hypothetical protein